MRIFVVNCGSSSIKYKLFEMADESVLASGLLQRVGTAEASLTHKAGGDKTDRQVIASNHSAALKIILEALVTGTGAVLGSIDQIDGVGHRVVHGGTQVTGSRVIDESLLEIIRNNCKLAPLHNPPNLAGIEVAMAAVSDIAHVAVFDTVFLTTLPPKAYRYAVCEEWLAEHNVRKYGFQGTSHKYITLKAAELLGKSADEVNLITVHLGNGCSATAVAGGRAVDHSMGMTPLEGLVMGTRSGDIDAAVTPYLVGRGLSIEEVDRALNEQSGLLGVSGVSNDMRDLLAASEAGNQRAALAIDMFVYRIIKYIGAYYAVLPAVDAVVFTGGIGENSPVVRKAVCDGLVRLGVVVDEHRNRSMVDGQAGAVTAADSELPVWVIPTDEELMIARETAELVGA